MIKIESLTKTYKSKKSQEVKALDNINVILPNNGLVFVVGKSGSGKSTLLNLIGGLDSITEGKVIVDGNDISKFKERNYCDYRNNHIGFIFQDYHLIDELTIYENIVLSLNLKRMEDKDLVKNALKKVDLEGYEERYPTELSGGERQRVAIARAIVKSPIIILADEPTGNLDTSTSKKIISLLKLLSKECLVLIVSHNINDAHQYADRIIELSKGKIISDLSKNPNYFETVVYEDNKIYYPCDKILDDNDIDTINQNLAKTTKVVKLTDKFINTNNNYEIERKVNIETKQLSIFNEFLFSLKFLKNKILNIFFASFMVSLIMVVLALSVTIINFNGAKIIAQEMDNTNQTTLLMNKVVDKDIQRQLEHTYRAEIEESDIQSFYNAGYEGKIYPVLNINVPVLSCENTNGFASPFLTENPFIRETLGTIIVDEEFLIDKFGKIEYAAKLDSPYPEGLIVTDYVADSIIATLMPKYLSYEDIIGEYIPCYWNFGSVKINGIIKTDYKEKHCELFEKIKEEYFEKTSDLYDDHLFVEFINDVYYRLGYSYTINQDYINSAYLTRRFNSHTKLLVNDALKIEIDPFVSFFDEDMYEDLKGKNMLMSFEKYNDLFGTSYDATNYKTFVPHKIKFSSHHYSDINNENPLYTYELTIDGLHTAGDTFIFNEGSCADLRKEIYSANIFNYALYFDGVDGIGYTLDIADEINYEPQSLTIETVHTMTKTIDVFTPIFGIVAIALCGGVIFILVNFSSKMIRSKMHEIGILKAIGTQNKSIGMIFGIQIMLIAIITMISSIISYYYCVNFANDLLVVSLKKFVSTNVMVNLLFFEFEFYIAMLSVLLISILSLISFIFPMIKIKHIKPVQIIKAKE